MKIRNSVVASFLLLTLAVSCQSTEKEATISLDNKTIQDFSSYTSIGYGSAAANASTESNTKKAKFARKNKNIKEVNPFQKIEREEYEITSTVPFSLIGQEGDNIKNLKVQNNSNQMDIEISGYCELPDFIAFSYGSRYENQCYNLRIVHAYPENQLNCWKLKPFENVYLLSKKTGKIYDFSKVKDELGLQQNFIGGTKAFYVIPEELQYISNGTGDDNTEKDNNYYRITEENESLVFTKSFSYKAFNSLNITKTDKYGNFMNEQGTEIVTTNGTLLNKSTLPTGVNSFKYDAYLNTIYADSDTEHYYLNSSSEFSKTNGPIGCQNEYTEQEIAWGETYDHLIESLYTKAIRLYTSENKTYYYSLVESGVISFTMESDYAYTIEKVLEIPNANVITDNYIYYFDDSTNTIYKYDLRTYSRTELTVDGYRLTNIDMDDYGNITVSGYDSSLNSFTGYLTQDDKIVLEPIVTDGYLTYSLTPLN